MGQYRLVFLPPWHRTGMGAAVAVSYQRGNVLCPGAIIWANAPIAPFGGRRMLRADGNERRAIVS
jgi:hypothetical protein